MIKAIFAILVCTGLMFGTPLLSEALKFRIDTNHSNIGFSVPIAGGLSKVRGKFSKFEMDFFYDPEEISNSKIDVKIDVSSVDTGINGRDRHLRTADFFDVEKHPHILFKSTKVHNKDGRLMVTGDLTMRGVTKEIRFPFEITGKNVVKREGERLMTAGFKANLVLGRREYGVNYQHRSVPGFIGNNIEIDLSIITSSTNIAKTAKKPKETKN